ncbi:50S ribosomal protein L1 [Candidatus Omnitrophota bacterium]
MEHSSKRHREAVKQIDKEKVYDLKEAVALLQNTPKPKFDETVELALNLHIDPKKSDQMVRGTVVLPHGSGKKVTVAVFCKGEHEAEAKEAGAEIVGAEDLMEKVSKGFLNFDCAISTPDMMRELSKLGKVLGPRGLMPSPKTGTVTTNIAQAIKEVKAGKVEFKSDKQASIHLGIAKRSFATEKIIENVKFVMEAIHNAKPSAVKGELIKGASLSTTMGPGIRVAL